MGRCSDAHLSLVGFPAARKRSYVRPGGPSEPAVGARDGQRTGRAEPLPVRMAADAAASSDVRRNRPYATQSLVGRFTLNGNSASHKCPITTTRRSADKMNALFNGNPRRGRQQTALLAARIAKAMIRESRGPRVPFLSRFSPFHLTNSAPSNRDPACPSTRGAGCWQIPRPRCAIPTRVRRLTLRLPANDKTDSIRWRPAT